MSKIAENQPKVGGTCFVASAWNVADAAVKFGERFSIPFTVLARTAKMAVLPVAVLTGKAAILAAAVATSAPLSSFAAALDLAGVDRTVTDVADLASYDEGVTNSSSTLATLTFDISDDQTYSGVLGGKLKLVKSGTGTLTLDKADRTYIGGTQISAGKLKLALDNPKALGSGNITVVNGAALDLYGCLKSTNSGFPANLYAEGTGTDGTGAILNTGYNHVNPAVQKLYLTGDLLVNRAKRIDFGTIYMQGHDLRLIGASESAVTTVNNSQGGDLFIDAGKYTLFGNNAVGNTPSAGKVYLRGGMLNFYGTYTTSMDVIVDSDSTIRQGKNNTRGQINGSVTLNANITADAYKQVVYHGGITAPADAKSLTINDAGAHVRIDECLVTNVNTTINFGTMTLGNGARMISHGQFVVSNTKANSANVARLNIEDGSDTTVGYMVAGNGGNYTKTGIVNQVSGTFRTTGRYNTSGQYDGVRLGHYPYTHSEWNISGGRLIVEGGDYNLTLAANGHGELNISGGEVTAPTLRMLGRNTTTGSSALKMTGGVLNLGAGGLTKNSTATTYAITLGGGTIRATAAGGFTSPLNMTLTGSSGTNVTFDTQAANVTISGVLSGVGGLQKTGSGTLTLSGANTYSGATTVKGGTVAFTSAYPGGDLEIDAATLAGASSSIVTAASLVFSSGKGVRILNADTLNTATFRDTKTLAASTAQIATLPTLTFVASDGTTIADTGKWHYRLSSDGRTLKFGPYRGLSILIR